MKALLLAAGLGTRLRPLTNMLPKCLVPINDKPLLEYWLEHLTQVGINEFLINTHYLHVKVEEFINQSKYKDKITLTYEKELLNTGGTLLENRDFFNNESFMLVHADNLSFCDFSAFINAHDKRKNGCEITMMTFVTDTPSSCGVVKIDEDAVVQEFYEKVKNPPSNLANGAVYICEPSLFAFLEHLNKANIDFSNDVLPAFMGKINTFLNDNYHRDIGSLESYAQAQIDMKNRGTNLAFSPNMRR
ncbi:MAG: nucleotidyltransferase family protein [Sulfurospirillaceae bacterium]|nr:nucleotidyltransferase family protein [Sulfurospirillaceae bacterium]